MTPESLPEEKKCGIISTFNLLRLRHRAISELEKAVHRAEDTTVPPESNSTAASIVSRYAYLLESLLHKASP